jgi:plasmid stability protein
MPGRVMIQIRNVPAKVHRILKARAALSGMSLSDYLLADLQRAVEKPTREEWLARLALREPISLPVSAAELVRQERDAR